jgi:ribosomal 30S subunit maturation factor RimM
MEYYKIGYIANTLGIKGEMKVLLLSNIPDRFKDLEECYINTGTGRQRVNCTCHWKKGWQNWRSEATSRR